MVTKNLLSIPAPWPRIHRSWNQQFIPKKLAELARAGVYYDSYALADSNQRNGNVSSNATECRQASGANSRNQIPLKRTTPEWKRLVDSSRD